MSAYTTAVLSHGLFPGGTVPLFPGSGGLVEWVEAARDALAALPSFQAWVGAADATEALDYIILFNSDDETLPDRYCGIYQDSFERNREGLAAGNFRSVPEITFHFEEAVAETDPTQAALIAIAQIADDVMGEMENLGVLSGWVVDPMDPSRAEWRDNRDHVTMRVGVRFVQ